MGLGCCFSTGECNAEKEKKKGVGERGKVFRRVSCRSVLWIIKSCVLERWYMSILIVGMNAELINILLKRFSAVQRSTLRQLRKSFSRRASLVRNVTVDDDACVHACVPMLGYAVVPIQSVATCGGGCSREE
jgi:hypothetical protein